MYVKNVELNGELDIQKEQVDLAQNTILQFEGANNKNTDVINDLQSQNDVLKEKVEKLEKQMKDCFE